MAETYSSWTGLIYIFNLIIGTGALTLPAAFSRAGWALGMVLMCILSFVSYVTTTFVVEAMATSNALLNFSKSKQLKRIGHYLDIAQQPREAPSESEEEGWRSASEESPLNAPGSIQDFPRDPVSFYTIDNKVEMGEMANLLFNRGGRLTFFLCFVLYLYGDLAIYASAIGQSLMDSVCQTNNFTADPDDKPCRPDSTVYSYSTMQTYRLFLLIFISMFGPFVFFNVHKTKYIQFLTTVTRWLAFGLMIYLTFLRLLDPSLPHNSPSLAVLSGFPSLLSSCVYAFMCHHSLPSLVTPMSNKNMLYRSLAADYVLVLSFYLMLALPAVFAFPQLNNLFTLNFVPQPGDSKRRQIADYFLILFPVFTISASFPIISVTLRNNLQSVVSPSRTKLLRFVILPLAAVIPPVLVVVFLPNIEMLVGVTGAYAGVGIQYVIPAMLVMSARRNLPRELSTAANPFASPFRHPAWPLLVILWAIICVSFATVHIIGTRFLT